jgi:hypothetical protein
MEHTRHRLDDPINQLIWQTNRVGRSAVVA